MAHNLTQADELIPRELIALTNQVVTPEQFEQLCIEYDELRLELTSTGELIVMPGTGGETGVHNAGLTHQLWVWTKNDGSGVCFDSSTMFALPNGAIRSLMGRGLGVKGGTVSQDAKELALFRYVRTLSSSFDPLVTAFQTSCEGDGVDGKRRLVGLVDRSIAVLCVRVQT